MVFRFVDATSYRNAWNTTAVPSDNDGLLGKSKAGLAKDTRVHIYWLSPVIMVLCLISGASFAVGHHFYYHRLNARVVGNTQRQQWSLR
jgi:hypothetical protein